MSNPPINSQTAINEGETVQDKDVEHTNGQQDSGYEEALSDTETASEDKNADDENNSNCSIRNANDEETQIEIHVNFNLCDADFGERELEPEEINKDVSEETFGSKKMCGEEENVVTTILAEPFSAETTKIKSAPKVEIHEDMRLFLRRYLGILYAIFCSVCYSLSCLTVSQLITQRGFGASYCFFWRFLGVAIPGIFILMYYSTCKRIPVFSSIWPLKKIENLKTFGLLTLRVVIGIASIVLHYLSLQYIQIGDAATIVFSNPAVVMLIAWIVLREPLGWIPMILSLFTAIGVAVISKPTFLWDEAPIDYDRILGVALATGSMMCNALVFITLRSLKNVHFSVVGIVFGGVGVFWGAIETELTGEWKTLNEDYPLWDAFLLIALATFSFVAQILLTLSLKYEEAGVVSAVRTFDVVFSFIWQCATNNIPDYLSLIGAAIVITCVSLVLFRKFLIQIPDDRSIKKKFQFLLH